ncbi:hypothetical protein CEXT_699721 [Caerostris extrusa]|uniref:Uncharacterized protein n=1 Tax=Caerostris extrusa TaxID=172846 RepID=A0AAV4T7M5_CAEEX|nr:hypothetical protein CEXT_699721 [Caerostris extrusa]
MKPCRLCLGTVVEDPWRNLFEVIPQVLEFNPVSLLRLPAVLFRARRTAMSCWRISGPFCDGACARPTRLDNFRLILRSVTEHHRKHHHGDFVPGTPRPGAVDGV